MSNRSLRRLLGSGLLCLAALACAPAAQAVGGVFKWVDSHGVVHYDDKSLLAERLTRATIAHGLIAADAKATVPEEFVQEVAQQCADLKERSARFASARQVFASDPVGNQYRLSDNQIALERAVFAEETQRYCRPLAAQYLLSEARDEEIAALKKASESPSAP